MILNLAAQALVMAGLALATIRGHWGQFAILLPAMFLLVALERREDA